MSHAPRPVDSTAPDLQGGERRRECGISLGLCNAGQLYALSPLLHVINPSLIFITQNNIMSMQTPATGFHILQQLGGLKKQW